MSRAVCPGSFDPVTHGHLDIIERTTRMFDEVIVAVGANVSKKKSLFTPDERVDMLTDVSSSWPGVRAQTFDGLLVDFCREHDVDAIVKGLRFAADFDYELQMAQMNHRLTGIDTIFLPTAAEWSYVSSSLVREIAGFGGDVAGFLPESVARRTAERIRERRQSAD